jgi:peptidoglycan/LPS O-acetylase OafA/YrhL
MTTATSAEAGERPTLGLAYSGRHNSLNFLRLVLALVVVVDHAYGLGGFGSLVALHGISFGTIAVYGFFGISGFLIAGSAERNGSLRYLWQRVLRIFPGFWVCLLVTALVFGVIGWFASPLPHCGLSCYAHAPNGPTTYVTRNWLLPNQYWAQFQISGTPNGVPFGVTWNGSIWTLFYEFLCYLMLLALGLAGFLRHRLVTLVGTVGLFVVTILVTATYSLNHELNIHSHSFLMNFLKFAVVFLTGSVLYLYRDRIPDSGWLALVCACTLLVGFWLPNGNKSHGIGERNPLYFFTYSGLLMPFITYPLLWLGHHLPFQRVGSTNDYSYGIYIYGYPVTQLIAVFGVQQWGLPVFLSVSILATAPFAVASWWFIEKRALSLKRLDVRSIGSRRRVPSSGSSRGDPVDQVPVGHDPDRSGESGADREAHLGSRDG